MTETALALTCVKCGHVWPADEPVGDGLRIRFDFGEERCVCTACFIDSLIDDAMQKPHPGEAIGDVPYDPDRP